MAPRLCGASASRSRSLLRRPKTRSTKPWRRASPPAIRRAGRFSRASARRGEDLERWTIPRPRIFLRQIALSAVVGSFAIRTGGACSAIPHLVSNRRFAMTTRKLEKKQWRSFFDRVSTTLEGKEAEIEIASLRLGDQVQAEWLPLLGIAYDPHDDIVEVALEGLDHLIPKPRDSYVEDAPGGLVALEIVDADDVKQIVKLRDPLMLPAPSQMK